MKRERELVKNTFVLSIGKFLPKLCTFITLPILTAYLTKAEYGTQDLLVTLVMLLIPIATLQIQSAAFRFLIDCRSDTKEASCIISNIFVVTIPISIVASIIIQFFFPQYSMSVRVLIVLYFFLDTIHLTVGQIARGLGNNKVFSIAAILSSVVYTIGIIIGVYWLRAGLLGMMAALVAAQLIATLFLINKVHIKSFLKTQLINMKMLRELLAYSWPMVPNNLSTWVLKLSDRLVITAFLGVEANAVYAVSNKIPNMLSIAQSIMIMAWQENASVAANDKDADRYYSTMLDRVFCFMISCTALLIAVTPILFKILIRGDYAEAYFQIPVLILAMFFYVMSSYFGGIYIAHKKTVNVGISTMVAAAINLTIDLAFVRIIGVWAGSISTLVAYFVLYYYRAINCQTFQKVEIKFRKQTALILIIVLLLISCFMQKFILNGINLIVAILIFLYLNKSIIKAIYYSFVKKLKRKAKK